MLDMSNLFRDIPTTVTLILLSCLISAITWFGSIHSTLYWLIFDQQLIMSGQVWRIITPVFLHFPAMGIIFAHLAFNMIWLWQFGSVIEHVHSSRFLLWLVIAAGVVSNVVQSVFSFGIFGGMSGVVYALLGYLFVRAKLQPSYPARVPDNLAYFLIGFMVLSALGLFGSSIANAAHFSGFAVGALIGGVLAHR